MGRRTRADRIGRPTTLEQTGPIPLLARLAWTPQTVEIRPGQPRSAGRCTPALGTVAQQRPASEMKPGDIRRGASPIRCVMGYALVSPSLHTPPIMWPALERRRPRVRQTENPPGAPHPQVRLRGDVRPDLTHPLPIGASRETRSATDGRQNDQQLSPTGTPFEPTNSLAGSPRGELRSG